MPEGFRHLVTELGEMPQLPLGLKTIIVFLMMMNFD